MAPLPLLSSKNVGYYAKHLPQQYNQKQLKWKEKYVETNAYKETIRIAYLTNKSKDVMKEQKIMNSDQKIRKQGQVRVEREIHFRIETERKKDP